MIRCLFYLLLALDALMAPLAAATSLPERLNQALMDELERSGAPSLQLAVAWRGEVVFEGAVGHADLEQNVAATKHTRYRTASVSKWFTATAAMTLWEAGKLDLDAPVEAYCPAFPEKRWPVTTRQLLTHTSGIRGYADYAEELAAAATDERREDVERRRSRDLLGMVTRYTDSVAPLENFKDDALVFEPGSDWLYSSYGYRVLACVLEGASGLGYSELLDTRVLGPAGLTATVSDDAWAIIRHRAAGYRLPRSATLRRADLRDVSENLAAGGHLTTATDLVRFGSAYQSGQLLAADTVELMTAGPASEPAGIDDYASWRFAVPSASYYGYGVMLFPHETERWIGHTGRQAGASSIVVLVPEKDLAIAVLSNVKGWNGYLGFVRTVRDIAAAGTRESDGT